MRCIYSLFDDLYRDSRYALSRRTLDSLKDFYFGYLQGVGDCQMQIDAGEPPFSDFPYWLARRIGKSKPSIRGRWSRYSGGWWRILEEHKGSGEVGFSAFFELLTEFRSRRRQTVLQSTGMIANEEHSPRIVRLEAVRFVPDDGYYLVVVRENEEARFEGFYSVLEELRASASERFNVSVDDWLAA